MTRSRPVRLYHRTSCRSHQCGLRSWALCSSLPLLKRYALLILETLSLVADFHLQKTDVMFLSNRLPLPLFYQSYAGRKATVAPPSSPLHQYPQPRPAKPARAIPPPYITISPRPVLITSRLSELCNNPQYPLLQALPIPQPNLPSLLHSPIF